LVGLDLPALIARHNALSQQMVVKRRQEQGSDNEKEVRDEPTDH